MRLERSRGRAMGARVVRTARALGFGQPELNRILRAHDLAMEWRDQRCDSDHAPPYLHPGRSALVALEDGGVREAEALEVILVFDSVDGDLAPDPEAVGRLLGEAPAALRSGLPSRDQDPMLIREGLVGLLPALRDAALAEALDHARHLHIGTADDRALRWKGFKAVEEGYAPVARAFSAALSHRFDYWLDTFRRRFLAP